MKGFINKCAVGLCLATAFGFLSGCATGPKGGTLQSRYYDVVDPSWPERYGAMASSSTNGFFAAQVNNGHVLDQTAWNEWFEPGTEVLTPMGMEKLNYLSRRRPTPDSRIYLQTAHDVPYTAAKPEEFIQKRDELNNARVQSLQRYLQTQSAGRGVAWNIQIHDPSPVGGTGLVPITPAPNYMSKSVLDRGINYQGKLIIPRTGASGQGVGAGNF